MLNEEEKKAAIIAWKKLMAEGKTDTLPMTIFMMGFGAACDWHREKLLQKIAEDIAVVHNQMAGHHDSNVISQIVQTTKL